MELHNLTKEEARKQFDYHTKALAIKHVFSFDEMWDYLTFKRKQNFRKGITAVEKVIKSKAEALVDRKDIDAVNPLRHTFVDGIVVREIYNPPNEFIVTKIHKKEHPFFLLKGDMSILTEEGPKRIMAPYYGITKVGTKRLIYTHDECIFVDVFATNVKTIKELEDEVFTDDFNDLKEEL